MLDSVYKVPNVNDGYELTLPIDSDWSRSKKRVLIILQSVDRRDLKAFGVLRDKDTMLLMKNCLKFTRSITRTYNENAVNASYAVLNFNARRHLHLPSGPRAAAEQEFATRVHNAIAKIQPTHVLVSGDLAMSTLWPSVTKSNYKRGWVHSLTSGELKLKVTSTLDLARLVEPPGTNANLLGFWCRHLNNLLLGAHPHSLKGLKPEPVFVDTIEKFDRMLRILKASSIVACDTETRNLSILHNKIYTIQFAGDKSPTTGYVVPLHHPLFTWAPEDLKYIKRKLKDYLGAKRGTKGAPQEMVFFNGMFDLRVIRRQFKLPIIWHNVWEITAGEHDLDENIKLLGSFGAKPGGLAAVLCSYENEFYFTAEFSKEDRGSIGTVKPNSKGFLMYGSMDVVSILHMRKKQIEAAKHQFIGKYEYAPFFKRHVITQMSNTAHQLSHLKEAGSKIDVRYLRHLIGNDSPLRTEIAKLKRQLLSYKEVKEANSKLLGDTGFKSKGLSFGKKKTEATTNMFSWSKSLHLKTLFFDVMGLKPINESKKTGEPSVDKDFIAEYKIKNPIVNDYGALVELMKLVSTYARGWYKRVTTNLDALEDGHLRADYSFWDVATGRLASKNPNLQNIPARSKLAKIIKRMFVAPKGYLLVRYDYSAHEVRGWSIISGDMVLADAFRAGQKLRQKFIKDPSPENAAAIKKDGDIHLRNVKTFFNKIVEKSDPLRDAVKAVVFGVLYGKGASTLGEDTKIAEINELKAKQAALIDEMNKAETDKNIDGAKAKKELATVDQQLKELMEEDRSSYAQGIIDKMMTEFKKGAAWTKKMAEFATEKYYVYAPTGRKRNLFAGLTGDKAIVAQQVRKGSNAPVQGMASEIGVSAGRVITECYYEDLEHICDLLDIEYDPWALQMYFNRSVHDANYYAILYALVIPFIHILQYGATYGVTQHYKEAYGLEFTIEPEIEIETGAQDSNTFKWDWSLPALVSSITKSVEELDTLKLIPKGKTKEDVLKEIFRPWKNKKCRRFLQEKYPLLGVSDLDEQIQAAIKPIFSK